jgi:hypothetical protein
MKMERVRAAVTPVNFYQNKRCDVPENSRPTLQVGQILKEISVLS